MHILVLLSLTIFLSIKTLAAPFTVIIDPGHGGIDTGAVRLGLNESTIALQVSKKLHRLLKKENINSILTRTSNKKLTLKQRAQFANRHNGNLFLSIHANSSPHKKVTGAEFYFQNQLPPSQDDLFLIHRENEVDQSKNLKQQLHSQFNTSTNNTDLMTILEDLLRNKKIVHSSKLAISLSQNWKSKKKKKFPVRQAPFYLFSRVNMPSTLIELGYLTNKKEAQKLSTSSIQNQMAEKILSGILKFQKTIDKNIL